MPQVPTTPDKKAPGSPRPLLVPPEETLWKRYSPHHEFPLSGATSGALHLLVLGLLLLLGWLWWNNRPERTSEVPAMEPVVLDHGEENSAGHVKGGSGGGNNGKGSDSGAPAENVDPNEKVKGGGGDLPPEQALADPPEAPKVEIASVDKGTRTIVSGNVPGDLGDVAKKAYTVLAQRQTGGKGVGSKGSGDGVGGGRDKGIGKGVGKGNTPGQVAARRAQRQLRWRLIFNRDSNGPDYKAKLAALSAILVVAEFQLGPNGRPIPDNRGQARLMYRKVIRDLRQRPPRITMENVRNIPGIFWIDDQPGSVGALAQAIGIPAPPLFACFFSAKVENELRRLEQEKAPNLRESDIYQTFFHVELSEEAPGYKLYCDRVVPKRR